MTTPSLPLPERERWQPLRAGLLNLYLYEDEELWFEHGRLLLRGNNGTGKSRILALQLPFLFDGEVHPSRVEPDGDHHKRIEWHLLMNGKYPDRIGYTWLELGRRDEEGQLAFTTIGIGMHAVTGRGAPSRWYFITDRRKGIDLELTTDTGTPLTRDRLEEALEGRGQVFTRAADYRRAIDTTFFQLGEHRYRALVDLLIQLRKPQLSRQLDEERLSSALSEALPPLPESVVGDVAEALSGLERDRGDLDGYRQATKAASAFLERYRRYLAIAAKRRADGLRQTHSRYEAKQRDLARVKQEREDALAAQAAEEATIAELANAQRDAAAEQRALETSDAMRAAEQLRLAEERASNRQQEHQRSAKALDDLHGDRERRRAAVDGAEREHAAAEASGTDQLARCGEAAVGASLGEAWNAMRSATGIPERLDELPAARTQIDETLRSRLKEHAHLVRRSEALEQAQRQLTEETKERDRLAGELDSTRDERSEAEACQQAERQRLVEAYRAWRGELEELAPPDAADMQERLDAWLEGEPEDAPVTTMVSRAHTAAVRTLTQERAVVERRAGETKLELESLVDERQRLLAGHHVPPAPHPTRDVDGRDPERGAPLWTLCDWADGVSAETRAGYEAALEAAGLLDALVNRHGELVGEHVHDAVLRQRAGKASPSLADVLVVTLDEQDPRAAGLEHGTIEQILKGISIEQDGEVWVRPDGRFRVGSLEGRWSKPAAQHIGHATREQERRRRLEELERRIDDAQHAVDQAASALERHAERERRADAERETAPRENDLRRAMDRLARLEAEVSRLVARVDEADQRVTRARRSCEEAAERRSREAEELGLSRWLDDLEGLRTALEELRTQVAGLWPRLDALAGAATRLGRARQELDAVEQRCQSDARRLAELAREAEDAAIEASTLRQTVGEDVQQVLARLAEVKQRGTRLEGEIEQARERRTAIVGRAERARGEAERYGEELAEQEARRDESAESLRALAATSILGDAHEDLAGLGEAHAWSTTRAVEIARQIEQLFGSFDVSDEIWERSRNDLHRRTRELEDDLLPLHYQPSAVERAGVMVVSVAYQGGERTVGQLERIFADEVAQRQRVLDARERDVIEKHLIDEVSTQIHELLRHGEELVAKMNHEIASRPMSTGMRLRFGWEPRRDGPEGLMEARKKLLATKGTWSPVERGAIGDFLKRRLDDVRMANEALTWREQLALAFDYRAWHRFVIEREQDGRWQRLTRRTHGTGSGGEKAIALTVPQLAAAAAHYGSASDRAPRLILLDEAFVGVDSDMRGKCMELLAAFDLDFVMTSEREWGCYAGLPGLAIYQLTARPGIDAVHTTRWVWNGRERQRVEREGAAAP